jgi:general stress protein 26
MDASDADLRLEMNCLIRLRASRAVLQLLWPDKDREVWFSLGENHEKAYRFPDFLHRSTGEINYV